MPLPHLDHCMWIPGFRPKEENMTMKTISDFRDLNIFLQIRNRMGKGEKQRRHTLDHMNENRNIFGFNSTVCQVG